ncbi:hypothetical protein LZ30DRAFT_581433 [Colletotrichum cereale]|nr:hypothetical protein LZ30DRAFT_581433 [Colletotrichum cereale]
MSQTNSPPSTTMETSTPAGGAASLPVSGEQAVSQPAADTVDLAPETDEITIGQRETSPAAEGQTEQKTPSAPDLGAQKNAAIKTVRIVAQARADDRLFADVERFWRRLDDEVSVVYRNCYMYPNIKTVHVTLAGLGENFLPAGVPGTFVVFYYTEADSVYIAAAEDDDKPEAAQQHQQQAAAADAADNGGKRDLVVRIHINPAAASPLDDEQHKHLDWMPVLTKENIESEDVYPASPEFQHRLVWEMTQLTVDESLWKPAARAAPVVVGNLQLMSATAAI